MAIGLSIRELEKRGYVVDTSSYTPQLIAEKIHGRMRTRLVVQELVPEEPSIPLVEEWGGLVETFWSHYQKVGVKRVDWTKEEIFAVILTLINHGRWINDPALFDWSLRPDEVISDILHTL